MKYSFAALTLAIASAPSALGLIINTPMSVVQCQPVLLTFGQGVAPYYVSILPGGQPAAPALRSFEPTNSESMTWNVDLAVGNILTFSLKDSTGATAFTDIVSVQGSSDSACLNQSTTAAGGSATTATTPAAGAGTTTGTGSVTHATNTAGSATTTTAGTGTRAASGASTSQTDAASNSNGAIGTSVSYGLAGVAAAVGLALL